MSRGHEYMDYKVFYTSIFARYKVSKALVLHFQSAPKIKMSAFNFLDFHWAHSYGQDQMFRPIRKKMYWTDFWILSPEDIGAACSL